MRTVTLIRLLFWIVNVSKVFSCHQSNPDVINPQYLDQLCSSVQIMYLYEGRAYYVGNDRLGDISFYSTPTDRAVWHIQSHDEPNEVGFRNDNGFAEDDGNIYTPIILKEQGWMSVGTSGIFGILFGDKVNANKPEFLRAERFLAIKADDSDREYGLKSYQQFLSVRNGDIYADADNMTSSTTRFTITCLGKRGNLLHTLKVILAPSLNMQKKIF
jgi:hypothetical protein